MALATRRVVEYDEDGIVSVDYEDDGVIRADSRILPFDVDTPARRKRYMKLRAIHALRKLGWKDREIAQAVDYTERHVGRQKGLIRTIAEASGRV